MSHLWLVSDQYLAAQLFTKILANRMKIELPNLVEANKSAFIRGKSISNNNFMAHEFSSRV